MAYHFKHAWLSGATMSFRGKNVYFANEMRTSLVIYTSDTKEFLAFSSSVNYFPVKCDSLEIEPLGDVDIRFMWGTKTAKREAILKQPKDISKPVMDTFAKYMPEVPKAEEMIEISAELFGSLLSNVMTTKVVLKDGNLNFEQMSPDGELVIRNIFDAQSAREGSILEFVPMDLPKGSTEIVIPTDEFINLSRLSNSVAFKITQKEDPMIGIVKMLDGSALFIIAPSRYKAETKPAKVPEFLPSENT